MRAARTRPATLRPALRQAIGPPRTRRRASLDAPHRAAHTPPAFQTGRDRRGKLVVVNIDDVVWFEMKDELVWAVTQSDRYALDLTLSVVEQRVPEGQFFRSHRGALVRIDRIVGIEPAGAGTFDLVLDHPEQPKVPLARERARLLRDLIPIAG